MDDVMEKDDGHELMIRFVPVDVMILKIRIGKEKSRTRREREGGRMRMRSRVMCTIQLDVCMSLAGRRVYVYSDTRFLLASTDPFFPLKTRKNTHARTPRASEKEVEKERR